MFQHHNTKKLYHLTEIIPSEKLKLTFFHSKERFLIAKREKDKLILTGLEGYLRNIKRQKEAIN